MQKLGTKNDIYELLSASTASAALGTAIETGLLWLLSEEALDGSGVAQALNILSRRCHTGYSFCTRWESWKWFPKDMFLPR
jgi:hypothetical protein